MWSKIDRLKSSEGNVEKFVFSSDNSVAESVLYRYPTYADRTVICCSTQSGCPVGCRFCGAGDYFVRNFTVDEIVSQPQHLLEVVERETLISPTAMDKLQIMFMSMGEPMLNLKQLIPALYRLHEMYPQASLLISSSGPKVDYWPLIQAAVEIPAVGLQFSVHESTDEARAKLIPFKAKMSLREISNWGETFAEQTGRRPFFNYCAHEENSSQKDVDRLTELFNPVLWESTVSVICERDETLKEAHERQDELTFGFMQKMLAAGYSTRMFNPAGRDDIGGGCGQLHYVQQWFETHQDRARPSVGHGKTKLHTSDPGVSVLNG